MPRIKTSKGVITYKTHPLFLGIKKIDKKIAAENLLLLKNFLDSKGIAFGLIAGTLLGAVRENDFISHDEDVDLSFLAEQKDILLDSLSEMKTMGFEVARYDRRGLLSIIRKGEYIDIYFFKKLCDGIRHCCGWCVPETFLKETSTFGFKGAEFIIPRDYVGFLEYEYGENWKTPVKWADFDMPGWKRTLNEWKEKMKELLPNWIFYRITKKTEQNLIKKYQSNINRYNSTHGTTLQVIYK